MLSAPLSPVRVRVICLSLTCACSVILLPVRILSFSYLCVFCHSLTCARSVILLPVRVHALSCTQKLISLDMVIRTALGVVIFIFPQFFTRYLGWEPVLRTMPVKFREVGTGLYTWRCESVVWMFYCVPESHVWHIKQCWLYHDFRQQYLSASTVPHRGFPDFILTFF